MLTLLPSRMGQPSLPGGAREGASVSDGLFFKRGWAAGEPGGGKLNPVQVTPFSRLLLELEM